MDLATFSGLLPNTNSNDNKNDGPLYLYSFMEEVASGLTLKEIWGLQNQSGQDTDAGPSFLDSQ